MKYLIERGLMFGNLIRVDSPVWVERYNRALKHLTGKATALTDFHIDISGFSPEVGDELGDALYLNHDGVNRQFILLTTEQATAPLLNAKFSTSRGILRQFILDNQQELFALTARDAVAGELVNSVFAVSSPADLFKVGKLKVEADTTGGTVRTAAKLRGLIDRFKTERDAWWDDALIGDMIALADETGDIARYPVELDQTEFAQDNFWTSHFGGLYLFRGVDHPAVISRTAKAALGDLPTRYVFDFGDRAAIAKFLSLNRLAEPVVEARGLDVAALLHQKMDFVVAEVASRFGEDLTGATRRDLRLLGRRYADRLPDEWQGLAALARWAEEGGDWPRITSDHPAYFYTLRASNHADADLVNMLLSELSPLDIRQLFICHKEAFYAAYAGWTEAKQAYVADFLDREYQVDKAGTRAALFGHDAPLSEPPPPPKASGPWGSGKSKGPSPSMIERVGPWGSVRRK